MLEDENTLYIYTDGSCYYRKRKDKRSRKKGGGVGILFLYSAENGKERIYELNEAGYEQATSQEMELQACTIALKEASANPLFDKYRNVVIYTDCLTLIDCYLKAERIWAHNHWLLADGFPVANTPLWKDFLKAKLKLNKQVELQKVMAHDDNIHNNRVHQLATVSAEHPFKKSLQVRRMRKKYSDRFTIRGSVGVEGQTICIHIIEGKYLHEHKLDWYRYEVINEDSKYYPNLDVFVSDLPLKEGHCYEVRLNKEPKNPRVVEIIRELDQPIPKTHRSLIADG